jgi:hypothetical protein
MDDTPQPSARDHPSGEQSSDPQYSTQVEEIPASRRNQFEKYYNRKSRLIVISGPRGPMLARYTGHETPEHGRHRFLVTYPDDYPVFESAQPPDVAPADVEAVCWPVERNRDPRFSLATGAASQRGSSGPEPTDQLFTTDYDKPITDQNGIRVTEHGAHMRGGGGGISVDKDGVRAEGSFKQTAPEKRGMTQQSPVFGILPKSVVTFFAADYLPDIVSIRKLIQFVNTLRKARSWLSLLRDDSGRFLDDENTAYGPNSPYVDDPEDQPRDRSDFDEGSF